MIVDLLEAPVVARWSEWQKGLRPIDHLRDHRRAIDPEQILTLHLQGIDSRLQFPTEACIIARLRHTTLRSNHIRLEIRHGAADCDFQLSRPKLADPQVGNTGSPFDLCSILCRDKGIRGVGPVLFQIRSRSAIPSRCAKGVVIEDDQAIPGGKVRLGKRVLPLRPAHPPIAKDRRLVRLRSRPGSHRHLTSFHASHQHDPLSTVLPNRFMQFQRR
ncbi:hypothetical protein HRbin36_01846 [bacterium HR36]|nr:hypothetical protein HRbin36_01846 [bacterium HR36]